MIDIVLKQVIPVKPRILDSQQITVYVQESMFHNGTYYNIPSTIPVRNAIGNIQVGDAQVDNDAINFIQLRTYTAGQLLNYIPMTSEYHILYGTDDTGVQTLLTYDVNSVPSTIVKRDSHGSVVTSDPVNKQDAVPLGYGDNRYVKKIAISNRLYGTDGNGASVELPYSSDAVVGTVAMRGYDGTLLVGDAVSEQDAANRRTVERMIASSTLSAMRYVGSVPTYSDLPISANNGDVYNVLDTGRNYVWDQKNGQWDDFGPNTDFSKFALKSDLPVIERWW